MQTRQTLVGTGPITALSPHLCRSAQQGLSGHNTLWDPSDTLWAPAGSCVSWILFTQPAGMGGITVLEPRMSRYSHWGSLSMAPTFSNMCKENQSLVNVGSVPILQGFNTIVVPSGCFSRRDTALKAEGALLVRTRHSFPQCPRKTFSLVSP